MPFITFGDYWGRRYGPRFGFALLATGGVSAPVITTTSLPDAEVGAAYSQTVVASGTAPITFAVTSGGLPAGLSLNANTGAITGTPTTLEIYSFTITATNAAGSDDQAYTVAATQQVFTQSIGSNLVTNPSFTAWGGANAPTGYTVNQGVGPPDPELTQVDSGQTHGGTNVSGGSANFFSTGATGRPLASQAVRSSGLVYESEVVVSARSAGSLDIAGLTNTVSTVGTFRRLIRAVNTSFSVSLSSSGNITVDSVSDRLVTLNTIYPAASTDMDARLGFTLPVSPIAGQRIVLGYRIPDAETSPLTNGWVAYLQRNDSNNAWDFRLDSVVTGTATNRINVTGVGTPNAVRVVTSGNDHSAYTGTLGVDSETWTQRGAMVTNTAHNTATRCLALYMDGFTAAKLRAN